MNTGWEMIEMGLADLAAGKESVESLLVSLAAPRLRREGLAHHRYLACLRRVTSFADACARVRGG